MARFRNNNKREKDMTKFDTNGLAEWLQEVEGAIEADEKRRLSIDEVRHLVYMLNTRDRLRSIMEPSDSLGPDRKGPASEASVQGTGLPGFAELLSRAMKRREEAHDFCCEMQKVKAWESYRAHQKVLWAFDEMIEWIDEISGCEEQDKAGERNSTSEAVP